ncbi:MULTISPECIES: AraC family transcriptional regulator [Alcanivorax]|jgi:AraC-like DNA-binding protein|uniref:Transcriptional regulator, AraC family n=1 Tax=Alcanivorax borkumensis (strain ATCC 700651 / DSM 11573 / NCIMB 13689 / SK2) TaxID=393595 RepID=Q0VMP4_ALCBS|nr:MULTISPECIES: AraC family transcriptional regulator [Alcanivorax]CAL17554.1 transcriptional regulator, AraC family [Alcanivorax borkumensis SK2]
MAVQRAITSVRMQVAFAEEQGVPASVCLHNSGIDLAMLGQADCTIGAEQELTVVRNLCRALGNHAELGLAMGQRYHLSSYGVWGFALLSSPTFRQAVELGLRYLDLTFAFLDVSLQQEGNDALLILDDSGVPEEVREYLLARDASAVMMIQEELFAGRVPLSSLEIRLPPRTAATFESIFGLVPEFGRPRSQARFALGLLDMPLPQANPVTARLCEEQCHQLLVQRYRKGSVAAQVRRRLLQQPGRFPDMEAMAQELAITSRTLRRHLQAEGTGYRMLLDEVRQMLAEQWLTLGILSLTEISERLGFSEIANFNHAFRRWTGQSPGRFRRERQG